MSQQFCRRQFQELRKGFNSSVLNSAGLIKQAGGVCLSLALILLPASAAKGQDSSASEELRISKVPAKTRPLSGQISVTSSKDKPSSTRLKRSAEVLPSAEPAKSQAADGKGDSDLQNLFPSKESNNFKEGILKEDTNLKQDSQLKGGVSEDDKARQAPYRWNISVYGGYYDASGQIPGVVRGDKLYLYGGTMSDGLTPAPRGPVPVNPQGHFKWQPVGGN